MAFFQVYINHDGNEKGFIFQVKVMAGSNNVGFTCGLGLGGGYQFVLGDYFAIEPLLGIHFLKRSLGIYRHGLRWLSGFHF